MVEEHLLNLEHRIVSDDQVNIVRGHIESAHCQGRASEQPPIELMSIKEPQQGKKCMIPQYLLDTGRLLDHGAGITLEISESTTNMGTVLRTGTAESSVHVAVAERAGNLMVDLIEIKDDEPRLLTDGSKNRANGTSPLSNVEPLRVPRSKSVGRQPSGQLPT